MLLGDLLARLREPDVAAGMLLSLEDLGLATRVRSEAAACGMSVGDFASRALARFADGASEEAWLTLMGAMARTDNPGQVMLRRVLEQALTDA